MIPLYILGMLLRYGPQHGYQIKKRIAKELADFTDIKLPAIYYHLEKMEASGYITAENVKEGVRPEKRVYCISGAGEERFRQLLRRTLDIRYRPSFEVDSTLFFSDWVETDVFMDALGAHVESLSRSLERIEAHRQEVVPFIPEDMKASAALIFEHHAVHYRAEKQWAELAISTLKEGVGNDQTESN